MAKVEFSGLDEIDASLGKLERFETRRVVMAGAEADVKVQRAATEEYRHVVSGSMRDNIRPAQYHETMNGGYVNVYPQGSDSRGVSNALKAFVTDRRKSRQKKPKTGDHFITGAATVDKASAAVYDAFKAELAKIVDEAGG